MHLIHFDLTVTMGNIVTLIGILVGILRIERLFSRFAVEHEILVRDYCERHEIKLEDLPTRFEGMIGRS